MDAPKSVEEIYEDFCGRRAALVAALTTGARPCGPTELVQPRSYEPGCQPRRAARLPTRGVACRGVARRGVAACTRACSPACACRRLLTCWLPRSADVAAFFEQCDPNKENLCLYGRPDGTWRVELPAEEVPPELPEPALGVNFARDGMAVRARLCVA